MMKKRVLAIVVALVMLAVMGYAYSIAAVDGEVYVPGGNDPGGAFVTGETTLPVAGTTGPTATTTTEPTTTTVPTTTTEWTGTDADGNPTPQPTTTAPPRFTNRPARTQPPIPWRPPEDFFHWEGGEVIGQDWVCYACAGLDVCIHWLELLGHDVDLFIEEGEIPDDPMPEQVLIGWEDGGMVRTAFVFNWLIIAIVGGMLLLAAAMAVYLLLRGKRDAALQAAMLGDEDNFMPQEESEPEPELEFEPELEQTEE